MDAQSDLNAARRVKGAREARACLAHTLYQVVKVLGPAAVAPCWAYNAWRSGEFVAPPDGTRLNIVVLRRLQADAQKNVLAGSAARESIESLPSESEAWARAQPGQWVIIMDDEEVPAQAPTGPSQRLSSEQEAEIADLKSELKALCFAVQRVQPVLEDALQMAELSLLERTNAEWAPYDKFTCAVCMNDDMLAQDAFLIERCGHRMCRPCALMTVDFNIKQGKAQHCVQCNGTPCPRCPISLWQKRKDITERVAARQKERVAACTPVPRERRGQGAEQPESEAGPSRHRDAAPGESQAGPSRPRARAAAAAAAAAGDEQGAAAAAAVADTGPSVKWCCMSQFDLRLLLQPEELQQRQVRRRERYKRRRVAEEAAAAEAAAPQSGRAARRQAGAAAGPGPGSGGAGPSRPQTRSSHGHAGPPPRPNVVVVDMVGSQDSQEGTSSKRQPAAGSKRKRGGASGGGSRPEVFMIDSPAGDRGAAGGAGSSGVGGLDEGSESDGEGWGWDQDFPPPTYEAYLKAEALRASHADHLFHLCPHCGEGIELAEGTTRLNCPSCKADKCVACGVDWHEDSTCEKYQQWACENAAADNAFKKLTASGEVKACPQCGTGITKIDGCHHMTCTSCKCKFCYKCGEKKSGQYLQTHGCKCMNGAAWEHDPRAMLPAGHPAAVAAAAAAAALHGAPAAPPAAPARGARRGGAVDGLAAMAQQMMAGVAHLVAPRNAPAPAAAAPAAGAAAPAAPARGHGVLPGRNALDEMRREIEAQVARMAARRAAQDAGGAAAQGGAAAAAAPARGGRRAQQPALPPVAPPPPVAAPHAGLARVLADIDRAVDAANALPRGRGAGGDGPVHSTDVDPVLQQAMATTQGPTPDPIRPNQTQC